AESAESDELRRYLARELPGYMIPSYFIKIEKIPLTPNGKIDRKALPEPVLTTGRDVAGPRNEIEAKFVEIWSEILGIEKDIISIDADFFRLGGHSIKATAMLSRIRREFNAVVPLIEVFKEPTIESLAQYVGAAGKGIPAVPDDQVVLLKPGSGNDPNLFLVHDGSGEVEGYMEFCESLALPFNCWGLQADPLENMAPRNCTVEEMAQRYIEKIRGIQPHGPYWIVGWSLGGTIAFEMAVQLEEMGVETGFLGLIDSPGPSVVSGEGTGEFTLESESDWLWEYLPGNEIKEKVKKAADINEIWPIIVSHLEENNFSVESVKRLIPDDLTRIIPHYDRSGIRELISYLNIGRTLTNARALYIPANKIHTTLHYFKAGESPVIFQDSWNDYCLKPIKPYEIPGDHFSLLKKSEVK
ncbi:MAG: hypothetical protein GY950_15000, partial [bacterium]|nr:hypothetical protein [bacterium]